MGERDPFLTRGAAVGAGRYDGHGNSAAQSLFGSHRQAQQNACCGDAGGSSRRFDESQKESGPFSGHNMGATSATPLVEKAHQKKFGMPSKAQLGQALRFHGHSISVLIMLPWLIFALSICLFALPPPDLAWTAISYAAATICAVFALLCLQVHLAFARGPIYFHVGALSLIAVTLGCGIGHTIYSKDTAEYWLAKARPARTNVNPRDSPLPYADAAVLGFTAGARLDLFRILGYRPIGERQTFCVAPVLDERELNKANFFAVGINCCEPLWAFSCDDALVPQARSGAVMSGAASVSASERYEMFRQAAQQAGSLYNLTVPEKPIFVSWLTDPYSRQGEALTDAVLAVVLFCVLYLITSMFLAALAHWSTAIFASRWPWLGAALELPQQTFSRRTI